MSKQLILRLKFAWILISALSLLMPIFFTPQKFGPAFFENPVGISMIAILLFSLPFSIFGFGLLALFRSVIELDPDTMFGSYFYLILLNVFGYIQWFWLAPKFFGGGKKFTLPTIIDGAGN